ncbi:hypothetical protein POL68_28015 [Stigmatella sp. ncwal1]|uniref:Uncharacterized protein n=1 Tax=Stigmatella ashevillensis TaxID=2995309 RepID=A0ABT5DFQ6_9BACT|nr:hypothetical protein [Stigmatella ashevillena]MDC0712341.1 hypothetical protein [Stigmatella ashevillena]
MPRISNVQIQERSTFLLELIRSQPDISRDEARERFDEKFSATLNPKLFQELREQVLEERMGAAPAQEPVREEPPEEASEEEVAPKMPTGAFEGNGASGQPAKAKIKAKGQRNLFVDAPKEQLVFLERIVQQLQEAGASNVRIDHSTDRWMVLVVDPK